jgi:hypothetical protein
VRGDGTLCDYFDPVRRRRAAGGGLRLSRSPHHCVFSLLRGGGVRGAGLRPRNPCRVAPLYPKPRAPPHPNQPQDGLTRLFRAAGFVCEALRVHARVLENRRTGVTMPRRWVQAAFRLDPAAAAAEEAAAGAEAAGAPISEGGAEARRQAAVAEGRVKQQLEHQQRQHRVRLAGVEWQAPVAALERQPLADLAHWLAGCGNGALDGRTLLLLPPPFSRLAADCLASSSGGVGEEEEDAAVAAAAAAAGTWAGLALLVGARRGARRACGVLADWADPGWDEPARQPTAAEGTAAGDGDDEQQQHQHQQQQQLRQACLEAYSAALAAALEANEPLVMCERLRCRRLRPGDARQALRLRADAAVARGGGIGGSGNGSGDGSCGGQGELAGFDLVVVPNAVQRDAGRSSAGGGREAQRAIAAASCFVQRGGRLIAAAADGSDGVEDGAAPPSRAAGSAGAAADGSMLGAGETGGVQIDLLPGYSVLHV